MIKQKNRVMLYACLTLICVGLLVTATILFSSSPKKLSKKAPLKTVKVKTFKKGTHTLAIESFGTAEAKHQVTLKAPLAGKALADSNLHVGHVYPPNTPLFTIKTSSLVLNQQKTHLQIQNTELEIEKATHANYLLKEELASAIKVKALEEKKLVETRSSLDSQKEIYSNLERLKNNKALSRHDFLEAKVTLDLYENQYYSQEEQTLSARKAVILYEVQLKQHTLHLASLNKQKKILDLDLEKIESDIRKSEIKLDFACAVTEVSINKEEEVTQGTLLAKVISIDTILIPIQIPDHYFKWISEEEHLHKQNESIEIFWLTPSEKKPFQGGYIESIGNHLLKGTRSLPIIVGRHNPPGTNGIPISSEELKPGAYCQVNINLQKVPNTFLIPKTALQSQDKLYYTKDNRIYMIENVKIIHEYQEEMIITLPAQFSEISLVTHKLLHIKDGSPVKVQQ